ncbi:hypothetical protein CDAR_88641 [Caerostris darwini]|uniref:Uncharacterized protein n=1 Tax=Caerostris darwini TaxID=1538125 RepID=A0AAV4NJ28_9ARAC|nr:hypothetical protein CDAR_88641 [Caerostris darwini]
MSDMNWNTSWLVEELTTVIEVSCLLYDYHEQFLDRREKEEIDIRKNNSSRLHVEISVKSRKLPTVSRTIVWRLLSTTERLTTSENSTSDDLNLRPPQD